MLIACIFDRGVIAAAQEDTESHILIYILDFIAVDGQIVWVDGVDTH